MNPDGPLPSPQLFPESSVQMHAQPKQGKQPERPFPVQPNTTGTQKKNGTYLINPTYRYIQ